MFARFRLAGVVLLVLTIGAPSLRPAEEAAFAQAPPVCPPGDGPGGTSRTISRNLTVFFGTVTPTAGLGSPRDGLELSDTIAHVLRNALVIASVDPRINTTTLEPWNNRGISVIEWVLAAPEGRPAQQNLLAAFQSYA